MGRNILRRTGIRGIHFAASLSAALLLAAFVPPVMAVDSHPATQISVASADATIFPAPESVLFADRSVRRTTESDAWAPVGIGNDRTTGPLPSRQTHEGPMVFSMDIRPTPILQRYLAKYQSPAGHRWLQKALERGAPYRDFITSRLEQAHMPPELYYLALIESTFVVHAVSRSGAVGMWQFMENSVGDWMTISEWVDERRDFWKSTDAAINKLQYNYSVLKNWLLAIAAYNAGLGYMSRLIERTGIHDFWKLEADGYLPPETAQYVPKFLAVAAIGSYAGRNGIELDWSPPPHWVRIRVSRPVDLRMLSEQAGIPLSVLRTGNAELNYGITPPGGHDLKVPLRYRAAAVSAISSSSVPLVRVYKHVVQSGETYWNISRRFGVPIDMLQRFNPEFPPSSLPLGARIAIPILDGAPDPAVVEAAETRAAQAMNKQVGAFTSHYTVNHGDTLWNIAQRFRTTPEDLAHANGMTIHAVLRIGKVLNVPAR